MTYRDYKSGTMSEVRPGVWRLRVRIDGHQHSRTIRTPKRGGKTQASEALRAFRDELEEVKHPDEKRTVGYLLDQWLMQNASRLRPTTRDSYELYVRTRLRPAFGAIKLTELGSFQIDQFYRDVREEWAPSTVRLCHSILSAALNQGVAWGWIQKSPAKDARPPAPPRKRSAGLAPADVTRLVRAAEAEDFDYATALALAAITGARRGELLGLQWQDVDWSARLVTISRAWVPQKGGQKLGPLKSGDRRVVPIGEVGVAILRRYQDHLRDRFDGWEPEPEGWLLSYSAGTQPLGAGSLTKFVTKVGKDLKPPLTVHLHSLRHFAATQLASIGVSPRVTADMLGHGVDISLGVYTDQIPAEMQRGVDHLGSIVAPALEGGTL